MLEVTPMVELLLTSRDLRAEGGSVCLSSSIVFSLVQGLQAWIARGMGKQASSLLRLERGCLCFIAGPSS